MLRLRIATALVGAILVIGGIFFLPPVGLAAAGGLVTLVAAWEWSRLSSCPALWLRVGFLAAVAGLALATWHLGQALTMAWLAAVCVFWVGVAGWLLSGGGPRAGTAGVRWGWLAIGLVILPPLALAIAMLAERADWVGRAFLLYAIGIVWAADIGAYFAGRAWGRHKLAPRVSAGKTVEGLVGGVVAVVLYALAGLGLFGVPYDGWLPWMAIAVVAGLLSVAGDLLESVIKREAGVKDSGRILPGHGGLLDRVDSLIAAAPVVVVGLAWADTGFLA
ncbi:MAG: phosphatidate cytidylyltransferase [Halofilum sp. (in: g-proteobacteria)]|nr:phosphatidate cytidylyltransferase [Halofilum sp. (in: g-proteobacteria)]